MLKIPINPRKSIAFLTPLYLVVFVESLTSNEWKALSEIRTKESFVKWIEELRDQKPVLRRKPGNELILYQESRDLTDVSVVQKVGDEAGNVYVSMDFDVVFEECGMGPKIVDLSAEKGPNMADHVCMKKSTVYEKEPNTFDSNIEIGCSIWKMRLYRKDSK